jgi:Reverse transcriptase (RNA-dependent DNA polymerase)
MPCLTPLDSSPSYAYITPNIEASGGEGGGDSTSISSNTMGNNAFSDHDSTNTNDEYVPIQTEDDSLSISTNTNDNTTHDDATQRTSNVQRRRHRSQAAETTVAQSPNIVTTRSGRISRPPVRYREVYESVESMFSAHDEYVYESLADPAYYSTYEAYGVSSDPDVLYYHEILQEPDCHQFIETMDKEIQQHNKRMNWKLVRRVDVPKLLCVLPSVWAMRRKRDLTTGAILKLKARINVDGSKQQYGIDYKDTYAPVASWASIQLILLISCLNNWT